MIGPNSKILIIVYVHYICQTHVSSYLMYKSIFEMMCVVIHKNHEVVTIFLEHE